ncbi:MAG: 5'-nucleotidase C-terminal domain-containing protein [Candidatus Cloacimonetes bacterium]|nr:5'-nucleotidase C-terminal domain-containing protein [Candidatus Cloacimonadota bacterium]
MMVKVEKNMKFFFLLLITLILPTATFAYQSNTDELILDIFLTNDMHGGIDRIGATFMNPAFPPSLGGGASMATYVNYIRQLSDDVKRANLLVDTGDFFMGRPIGTLTEGEAIVEFMNLIGYDLLVLGNHEYDLGEEKLINLLKLANFPVLAANAIRKGTEDIVDYSQPYIIIEKMGIKIGIVGVITSDAALMSFAQHIEGIEFLSEKDVLEYYVNYLRNEEKVDILIAAIHAGVPFDPHSAFQSRYATPEREQPPRVWGYDAMDLAHLIPGIDVILAGHIHVGMNRPWFDPINHTLVVQGYANLSNILHLILKIDPETKTISGFDTPAENSVLLTLFEDRFILDPEFDRLISQRKAEAEHGMDDVIGTAGVFLSRASVDAQNAMGNFICEAMKNAVGADFAFLNLGGVRAEIPMGNVTYRQIFNAMPFDNNIVTMLIDGRTLRRIIETRVASTRQGLLIAGGAVTYSRRRNDFDRVTRLKINGEPWEPDKIYRVATTDFLMSGNAGLTILTTIPETQIIYHETSLRDAMADYFRQNSPVMYRIDDRWLRDDRSEQFDYLIDINMSD